LRERTGSRRKTKFDFSIDHSRLFGFFESILHINREMYDFSSSLPPPSLLLLPPSLFLNYRMIVG
jgi:hypothetical protein